MNLPADAKASPASPIGSFGDPVGLVVTVAWLFALGLGPVYTLRNRINPPLSGQYIDDALVNAAFVGLHVGVIAVIVVLARRRPAISGLTAVLLVALHLLVIASAWWSLAPGRSATQGVLFALTTVAALVVGDRVGVRGVVLSLAVASQAGVVLSQLAVRRGWPNTIDLNGDWAGIYLNRNSLGPVSVLALLATTATAALWWCDRRSGDRRASNGAGARAYGSVVGVVVATVIVGLLLVDAHTLIRSASLTPLVGAVVGLLTALVALALPWWAHRRRPAGAATGRAASPAMLGVGLLVTWAGLALAAVVGRSALATGLDRSTTLSGRTELWGWLIDAISRRPFSGWGWLGVWEDRALEAEVVGRFDVDFSTAHNAVIEMLLGVGIVGAVLLVAAVGVTTWPVVVVAARPGVQRAVGVVALGFVGYVVAVNQLETYVGANLLPWALLIALGAACARQLRAGTAEPVGLDGSHGLDGSDGPAADAMPRSGVAS